MLLSTATVPGHTHTRPGQPGKINNQDAVVVRESGDTTVVVLADGCGSQPRSETGADIGANVTANEILKHIQDKKKVDWDKLPEDICEALVPLIEVFGEDFDESLLKRFMFTLIAMVVHKGEVTVAAFGDGIVVVDDELILVEPAIKNTPPYLGYLFRSDSPYHTKELRENLQFQIIVQSKLSEIKKSLVVATDGLIDVPLDEIHHPGLLGKTSALQFWLSRMALETVDEDSKRIVTGVCRDDVTLAVLRTANAQKNLVEGRDKIVKLKGEFKEFISDLTKFQHDWRSTPLKKDERDEKLGNYNKHLEYLEGRAKELDAVLDCQELGRQVNECLTSLRELPVKSESIISSFISSVTSFPWLKNRSDSSPRVTFSGGSSNNSHRRRGKKWWRNNHG